MAILSTSDCPNLVSEEIKQQLSSHGLGICFCVVPSQKRRSSIEVERSWAWAQRPGPNSSLIVNNAPWMRLPKPNNKKSLKQAWDRWFKMPEWGQWWWYRGRVLTYGDWNPGFDTWHRLKFFHNISHFTLIFCFSFCDTHLGRWAFLSFCTTF